MSNLLSSGADFISSVGTSIAGAATGAAQAIGIVKSKGGRTGKNVVTVRERVSVRNRDHGRDELIASVSASRRTSAIVLGIAAVGVTALILRAQR